MKRFSIEARRVRPMPRAVRPDERGFSMPELLVAAIVLFTLAAIGLSYVWRARLKANEANAVISLRIINSAEQLYSNTYGVGFSRTLGELGPPRAGTPSAEAAGLISSELASGYHSGYQFTYAPVNNIPMGGGKPDRKKIKAVLYSITADPVRPRITGVRYYYIDESGVIRLSLRKKATASSPPI